MVWALCWKSACGNRSRCKDLLQEVSITLWIHFDELRPDAVPQEEKAWVRWWTRSVLDLQRRKERPSLLPLTAMVADTVAADDLLVQKEEMEHLMAGKSSTAPILWSRIRTKMGLRTAWRCGSARRRSSQTRTAMDSATLRSLLP